MAKKRCQKAKQPSKPTKPSSSAASELVPPTRKALRCYCRHPAEIAFGKHTAIHTAARIFRNASYYNYGPGLEQRSLIWRGTSPFTWTEPTSGFSWIGVTGKNSTCVVAMRGEESPPRLLGRRQLNVRDVLTTALSDLSVGPCTDTSTVFRQFMLSHKLPSEKLVEPFAVVSVAPGFVEEENGYEGRQLAARFLEKRLELNPTFTSSETAQIAICALKCLLGSKFKSDSIAARGFGKWSGGTGRMKEHEVEQHLVAGNVMDLTNSLDSLGLSSPS